MNFPSVDSIFGRQRCRQWVPLITQQLRLRHLYQITAYNVISERQGSFYFTLHLTTLSAPFYTSEKINSPNPKWAELEYSQSTPLSVSGIVLRIWQHQDPPLKDIIMSTWGINFSGLVYVGNKLSEIQPSYFKENSIILHLRGGYFTSYKTIRTDLGKPLPFIDHLNLVSTEEDTNVIKSTACTVMTNEIRKSYDAAKLQKLHSLQIAIKNKALDAQLLREKIEKKCGISESPEAPISPVSVPTTSSSPPVRYATQLLTMNSLNKMLQDKPTKGQRKEIVKVNKAIEIAKWRTKLLMKERNQKTQHIRQLKQKYTQLYEQNEERDSKLMDDYRTLSKDVEKLREWRKEQIQQREDLQHFSSQLHHRRRQLITQLLYIYPIRPMEPLKYCINGVYLPDSDLLTDCSDAGLSVALGYVSHILTMCASFLQVPLRYPVVHWGSRSFILDQISPALTHEKEREFPLYTKGKDRMQFNYAVYLLNKNIAQLRLLCGLQTTDLRATLPNLLSFLQGKEQRDIGPTLVSKLEVLSLKLQQEEEQKENVNLKENVNIKENLIERESRKQNFKEHENSSLKENLNSNQTNDQILNINIPESGNIAIILGKGDETDSTRILSKRADVNIEENGDCSKKMSTVRSVSSTPNYKGGYSLSSSPNLPDPILDALRHQCQLEHTYTPVHKTGKKVKSKGDEGGPGLSEILAIPEAYLNRQISSNVFKSYMNNASSRLSSSSGPTEVVPSSSKSSQTSQSSINVKKLSSDRNATKTSSDKNTTKSSSDTKACDIKISKSSPNANTSNFSSNVKVGGSNFPASFSLGGKSNLQATNEVIEQGTDLLDPALNLQAEFDQDKIEVYTETEKPILRRNLTHNMDILTRQAKRKSRSVGSYTDEDKMGEMRGSDPVINASIEDSGKGKSENWLDSMGLPCSLEEHQTEFLQKWLDSGPALVCSEENLYPEEILGTVARENGDSAGANPLTVRTDALLSTTSFNLVKPKY